MEPLIKLNAVSKIYSQTGPSSSGLLAALASRKETAVIIGKTAVDKVSLTIERGQRVGIIGKNGAGKSTLLHMIAGLSSPTNGEISVVGKVTSIMTLGIGLREDLCGRENIYVDGEIQGKSRQEVDKVINEIIDFSELGKFIDYPVKTYSTGMKARLAFSMISYLDPEILIIDEALSVGDASFASKASAKIREICARGKIVIVVSHGMQAIREICNRCLWIDDGRVVMDGTPDSVTKSYIEAVRHEDEAALLAKFKMLLGARSHKAGYEVRDVQLLNGLERSPRNLIETGTALCVNITAMQPDKNENNKIRIRITRLDETLMFEQSFPVTDFVDENGVSKVEVEFNPLALGTAVYKVNVELLALQHEAMQSYAECSMIFEVYTSSPLTGGKPMLLYPTKTTSALGLS